MSDWLLDLTEYAAEQITPRAREALWSRGVEEYQIGLYQLGYLADLNLPISVPDHFSEWARKKNLRDVFVLPLTTTQGLVRGFQFRAVDKGVSGYMDYFVSPRMEACTFGLAQAIPEMWSSKAVFIVEGAFDLFPIQKTVPYALATLTSHSNKLLTRVFKRLVDTVWIGYDNDNPGKLGASRFIKDHGGVFEVYTVEYPGQIDGKSVKDPGDLWEAWGDTKLEEFIQKTLDRKDWLV